MGISQKNVLWSIRHIFAVVITHFPPISEIDQMALIVELEKIMNWIRVSKKELRGIAAI